VYVWICVLQQNGLGFCAGNAEGEHVLATAGKVVNLMMI
jgi:hypothetical protein